MRSRDPELNEQRRGAILEAAADCFVRRGFHASSMKDVAAEAGMSPGTLYHYFASKAEIVAGILERGRRTTAALLETLDAGADLLDGLLAVLDRVAGEVTERDLLLHAEVASELLRRPDLLSAAREDDEAATAALAGRFRLAREAGRLDPGLDPRGAAVAVSALLDGHLWRATLHGPAAAAADLPALRGALARLLGRAP